MPFASSVPTRRCLLPVISTIPPRVPASRVPLLISSELPSVLAQTPGGPGSWFHPPSPQFLPLSLWLRSPQGPPPILWPPSCQASSSPNTSSHSLSVTLPQHILAFSLPLWHSPSASLWNTSPQFHLTYTSTHTQTACYHRDPVPDSALSPSPSVPSCLHCPPCQLFS